MTALREPIWVCGEVLIDLIPEGNLYKESIGGGPANTAKVLGRLGLPVSFIGGISTDTYGKRIREDFLENNVEIDLCNFSEKSTALAKLMINQNGEADYEFKLSDSSTFDFGDWLPKGSPKVLHIGSLATVIEPGSNNLHQWAIKLNSQIVFDPNIRLSILPSIDQYRNIFEKWAKISSVIKISKDEMELLQVSFDEILMMGPKIVVQTDGENGINVQSKNESLSVEAKRVEVIDTVGAGDVVGAIIAEGLYTYGELEGHRLRRVIERAVKASSISCTKAGAYAPSIEEIER